MDRIEGRLQFYGFLDHVGPGQTAKQVRDDLAQQPGVRFVAEFQGACVVFAAAEYDTVKAAEAAIGAGTDAASLDWFTLTSPSRLAAPKRQSPNFCSIVRAQAQGSPPIQVLSGIDDRFKDRFDADPGHVHFSYGACVVEPYGADAVAGTAFDVLIDLGADSKKQTGDLAGELRTVMGVGTVWESNASLAGNAKRPGKPNSPA